LVLAIKSVLGVIVVRWIMKQIRLLYHFVQFNDLKWRHNPRWPPKLGFRLEETFWSCSKKSFLLTNYLPFMKEFLSQKFKWRPNSLGRLQQYKLFVVNEQEFLPIVLFINTLLIMWKLYNLKFSSETSRQLKTFQLWKCMHLLFYFCFCCFCYTLYNLLNFLNLGNTLYIFYIF
jgi:hypothetical protein